MRRVWSRSGLISKAKLRSCVCTVRCAVAVWNRDFCRQDRRAKRLLLAAMAVPGPQNGRGGVLVAMYGRRPVCRGRPDNGCAHVTSARWSNDFELSARVTLGTESTGTLSPRPVNGGRAGCVAPKISQIRFFSPSQSEVGTRRAHHSTRLVNLCTSLSDVMREAPRHHLHFTRQSLTFF